MMNVPAHDGSFGETKQCCMSALVKVCSVRVHFCCYGEDGEAIIHNNELLQSKVSKANKGVEKGKGVGENNVSRKKYSGSERRRLSTMLEMSLTLAIGKVGIARCFLTHAARMSKTRLLTFHNPTTHTVHFSSASYTLLNPALLRLRPSIARCILTPQPLLLALKFCALPRYSKGCSTTARPELSMLGVNS